MSADPAQWAKWIQELDAESQDGSINIDEKQKNDISFSCTEDDGILQNNDIVTDNSRSGIDTVVSVIAEVTNNIVSLINVIEINANDNNIVLLQDEPVTASICADNDNSPSRRVFAELNNLDQNGFGDNRVSIPENFKQSSDESESEDNRDDDEYVPSGSEYCGPKTPNSSSDEYENEHEYVSSPIGSDDYPSIVHHRPAQQNNEGSSMNGELVGTIENNIVSNEAENDAQNDIISQTTPTTSRTTRKRKKRSRFPEPEKWSRNVRKKNRALGQSYVDVKGRTKEAKVLDTTDCTCKYECRSKISIEQQRSIHKDYYSVGNYDRQKDFICKLIIEKPILRKRKRIMNSRVDKLISRACMLPTAEGNCVRVCQPFFLRTFGVSKAVFDVTVTQRSPNGTFNGEDRRKGRGPSTETPTYLARGVTAFLNEFPKVQSHYCRARSSRLYLAPDLNISILYQLYCDKQHTAGNDVVTSGVFRKMFNEYQPTLSIFSPKKDQCTTCQQAERDGTKDSSTVYKEHIARKNAIRKMKECDVEEAKMNKKMLLATFDLQAILTIPFAGDCEIYYKRKLSAMNFTIFDSFQDGSCFLWDECNGKKGSSEIGTCLLRYIDRCSIERDIEQFVFYSDTCGGQNRNKNIVAALLYAVNCREYPNLDVISLKYLESGHSQMEVDSMHACIERARKHKQIYSTNEYRVVIEGARKRPHPYKVTQMSHSEFYNLEALADVVVKNRTKATDGKKVNWLKVKFFQFKRGSNLVGFKYNVDDPEFSYLNVNDEMCAADWTSIKLLIKYPKLLPISLAKKKDLLSLLKSGVIPKAYEYFINGLPCDKKVKDQAVWNANEEEEEDPDDPAPAK